MHRYSVYVLYRYKSTNTDAEGGQHSGAEVSALADTLWCIPTWTKLVAVAAQHVARHVPQAATAGAHASAARANSGETGS